MTFSTQILSGPCVRVFPNYPRQCSRKVVMSLGIPFAATLTDTNRHGLIKRQRRKIHLFFCYKTPVPILTALITLPIGHFMPITLHAANDGKAVIIGVALIAQATHLASSHCSNVQPRERATRSHHAFSTTGGCWQIGRTGRMGRAGKTGGENERVFFAKLLRAHFPISPDFPTIRAASASLCCRAFSLQAGEHRFALYHKSASQASDSDRPRRKHSHATRRVALWPPLPLTAGGSLFK